MQLLYACHCKILKSSFFHINCSGFPIFFYVKEAEFRNQFLLKTIFNMHHLIQYVVVVGMVALYFINELVNWNQAQAVDDFLYTQFSIVIQSLKLLV